MGSLISLESTQNRRTAPQCDILVMFVAQSTLVKSEKFENSYHFHYNTGSSQIWIVLLLSLAMLALQQWHLVSLKLKQCRSVLTPWSDLGMTLTESLTGISLWLLCFCLGFVSLCWGLRLLVNGLLAHSLSFLYFICEFDRFLCQGWAVHLIACCPIAGLHCLLYGKLFPPLSPCSGLVSAW